MRIETLEKLFLEELQDIRSAEQQILKALPQMVKAASDAELKEALEQHLQVTEEHVERLDQIFEKMGHRPASKKCKGMAGLLEEGQEILKADMDPALKDAAIIGAAQRVEHYEMAVYGTLRSFADQLGVDDVARLLETTLDEEKEADMQLTEIAQSVVNPQAAGEEEEDDEARVAADEDEDEIEAEDGELERVEELER
ncbi:MAG TPA: ferritin-like domain-containing protein [Candidatus Polarisedimenticolaceae bacterium]|nr:ferritin-like domain-containing protein [Candidatus Polarisedimenticolaceae bacterium]